MKKQQGNILLTAIGLLFAATLAVGAIVGYVLNIVKLFQVESLNHNFGEVLIRVFGVFTGVVGAIAGYF